MIRGTHRVSRYSIQITRIREKLKLARDADPELDVRGAIVHRYKLNAPASEKTVASFEAKYGIALPECYRAFLLELGNGGAGPYYGLFPLGEKIGELPWTKDDCLQKQCLLDPSMTAEQWNDSFESSGGGWLAGVLPIRAEECPYFHGLILNGTYRGKVLNIIPEGKNARFTFEDHFLDWYERWLDEVISDKNGAGYGFDCHMGGSEEKLLENFPTLRDSYLRDGCLRGLLSKKQLSCDSIKTLQLIYDGCDDREQVIIIQILAKFDYESAKPYLTELAEYNLLAFFQTIRWYRRHEAIDWKDLIISKFSTITDASTFDFGSYLLMGMKIDYGELVVPFTQSLDPGLRRSAYYFIGDLSNKQQYVDVLLHGLEDCDGDTVIRVLQALKDIHDDRLLAAYKAVAEKHRTDKNILAVLNHRLKEQGLNLH